MIPGQFDHPDSDLGKNAKVPENGLGKLASSPSQAAAPKPLSRQKKNFLLIQVDGGGIKGITPAILLEKIEGAYNKRPGQEDTELRDITSVFIGTSTGAVIIGGLVAGVPADRVADIYRIDAYNLIRKDGRLPLRPLLQHNLQRKAFQDCWYRSMDEGADYPRNVRLGELSPSPVVIITSYDLVSKHTVFLSNSPLFDTPRNARELQLIDAMTASALSAPVFFGQVQAPHIVTRKTLADGSTYDVQGAAFADGGQGTQQCTLLVTAHEAIRIALAHPDSLVTVISLGCGNNFEERSPQAIRKLGKTDQLLDYITNSQSRGESIDMQVQEARRLESIVPNLQIARFDWHHTSEKDAASLSVKPRQRDFLINKAEEIAKRSDFQTLLETVADPNCVVEQFDYSKF